MELSLAVSVDEMKSSDIETMLRFLAAMFLTKLLMRCGDVEVNPGPNIYRGIGNTVLLWIAKIITQSGKIQAVGKGLDIPEAELDMYMVLADREGAYQMLLFWKSRTAPEEQFEKMRSALNEGECQDLADILELEIDDYVRASPVFTEASGTTKAGSDVAYALPALIGANTMVYSLLAACRFLIPDTTFRASMTVRSVQAVRAMVFITVTGAIGMAVTRAFKTYTSGSKNKLKLLHKDQEQAVSFLTDEMETILFEIMPEHCLSELGRALGLTPEKLETHRRRNEADNRGIVEMIRDWRFTVQEGNQVAALCELLVKANMKPQADQFYERCDRIINGKLLDTLKKTLDNVSSSERTEKTEVQESTSTDIFNENGGKLCIGGYGVTLHIPADTLVRGTSRQIAMRVLTQMPSGQELKLRENEVIASFGFQCYPSGLTFKKPVTLTMPHCADLIDTARCKLVLYMGHDPLNKVGITRIELSPNMYYVREKDFDLKLEHFSWGFVAWDFDWTWARGVRMLCMPFLPSQLPSDRKAEMEVCLCKRIQGCELGVKRGCDGSVRACLQTAEEFTVQSRGKLPLTVSYQLRDENEISDSLELSYEDLARVVENTSVFLELDLVGRGDSNQITLWLKPHRTQPIEFAALCEASSTGWELRTPLCDIDSSQRSDPPGPEQSTRVTEDQLMLLSQLLPYEKYFDLCGGLEINYNSANQILASCRNDYMMAYLCALMAWKARTAGGSAEALEEALDGANLGGFWEETHI